MIPNYQITARKNGGIKERKMISEKTKLKIIIGLAIFIALCSLGSLIFTIVKHMQW